MEFVIEVLQASDDAPAVLWVAQKAELLEQACDSIDQLWPWLDNGDHLKQWVSWLVDVKYPDPQKTHGVGASGVWVMKDENNGGVLMEIKGTCSEYTPPTRLALQLAGVGRRA